MSTIVATTIEDDDVFRAFALGDTLTGDDSTPTRSLDLGHGHHALVSHGVTIALRSEEVVVFDARPAAPACRCVCRVMAHVGRAGVFVHEHYADDEVCALDHAAFVALEARLRSA